MDSQTKAYNKGFDEADADLKEMSWEACRDKAILDYPNDWKPDSMEAWQHARGYYARLDQSKPAFIKGIGN